MYLSSHNSYKNILKESVVETTGMGGVFPSSILIGKVYDTQKLILNAIYIYKIYLYLIY